jgi:hypothetical protein
LQLPLDQLGFGNLTGAGQAAIQQQLQPIINNIQARLANSANAFRQGLGRGLLQDSTDATDDGNSTDAESPAAEDESEFTLEYYIDLVDGQIRPTLEAEGVDNATISQLVESTAEFLFSLSNTTTDVNFATRAAQVSHQTRLTGLSVDMPRGLEAYWKCVLRLVPAYQPAVLFIDAASFA